MNLKEYNKVKNYNYFQYCDYLQDKYGVGICDYMNKKYQKNFQISRTNEGLLAHHKHEYHAFRLCDTHEAKRYPFEYQKKENIVYCDYFEHFLLHMLIHKDFEQMRLEGIGLDLIYYDIKEILSCPSECLKKWQANCRNRIINDKDVYILLVKRYDDLIKECVYDSKGE